MRSSTTSIRTRRSGAEAAVHVPDVQAPEARTPQVPAAADSATWNFPGAWKAHQQYVPPEPRPTEPEVLTVIAEPRGRAGLAQAIADWFAVYRLNRAFRRNQREFDGVMDNVAHDPAAQRELQTSWALRD